MVLSKTTKTTKTTNCIVKILTLLAILLVAIGVTILAVPNSATVRTFADDDSPTAKAVWNDVDNGTIIFYYDMESHEGEGNVSRLPENATTYRDWEYSSANLVTKVIFDKSFSNYHGLKSTAYMFYTLHWLTTIERLEYLNTENVTNMSYMFKNTQVTTLNLSNFDTAKVTDMTGMFSGCGNLTTIYASDKFVTTAVTESEGMFDCCWDIVGEKGTEFDDSYIIEGAPNPDFHDIIYAKIDGEKATKGTLPTEE